MGEVVRSSLAVSEAKFESKTISKTIMAIKPCGCWWVNLAQGKMVLLCTGHEPEVEKLCNGG